MEVKVVLEDNKTNFENQLKEFLEKGYQIKDSNFICYNDTERNYSERLNNNLQFKALNNIKYKIIFYALLIKE